MLYPAFLTFKWEAVKGKKEKREVWEKGTNNREDYSWKITAGMPEMVNINDSYQKRSISNTTFSWSSQRY